MMMCRKTLDEQMRRFQTACETRGIKVTHQRMEIFRVVVSTEEHPDALSVYQRVRKRIPTISLDTVYRNLKLLGEQGLISIVGMSQDNLRFDANTAPHHHFVCVKCGMIRDFTSERIGAFEMPEEARAFGAPLGLHIEVKGICTRCQRNRVHP